MTPEKVELGRLLYFDPRMSGDGSLSCASCHPPATGWGAPGGISFGSPGTGNASVDSLRIYRTQDGGSSWNRIPAANLPAPLAGEGVWIYSGNGLYDSRGDTLWFGTRSGRVFRTVDRGQTWAAFGTGLVGFTSTFLFLVTGFIVISKHNQMTRPKKVFNFSEKARRN